MTPKDKSSEPIRLGPVMAVNPEQRPKDPPFPGPFTDGKWMQLDLIRTLGCNLIRNVRP